MLPSRLPKDFDNAWNYSNWHGFTYVFEGLLCGQPTEQHGQLFDAHDRALSDEIDRFCNVH